MTERTVEKEQESGQIKTTEAEVLDHLHDVKQSEALAADRWEAETTAEVVDVRVTSDSETLSRIGIRLPERRTGVRYSQHVSDAQDVRQRIQDAVDVDADLLQPPRAVVIEGELPSGDVFTDALHLPRTTSECAFARLCDALGIVPGVDKTLIGRRVPVNQTGNGWELAIPELDTETEQTDSSNRPFVELLIVCLYSLAATMFLSGLLATPWFMPFFLGATMLFAAMGLEMGLKEAD